MSYEEDDYSEGSEGSVVNEDDADADTDAGADAEEEDREADAVTGGPDSEDKGLPNEDGDGDGEDGDDTVEEIDEEEESRSGFTRYPEETELDLNQIDKELEETISRHGQLSECLSKYELAGIIGYRAQQLAEGAPTYVQVGHLIDPIDIAIREFKADMIPLRISRPYPASKGKVIYKVYRLSELIDVNPSL
jgi:DNA-directed RNA polymerase I, II, and III subunit RPABC2